MRFSQLRIRYFLFIQITVNIKTVDQHLDDFERSSCGCPYFFAESWNYMKKSQVKVLCWSRVFLTIPSFGGGGEDKKATFMISDQAPVCWITEGRQSCVSSPPSCQHQISVHRRKQIRIYFTVAEAELGHRLSSNSCSQHIKELLALPSRCSALGLSPSLQLLLQNLFGESSEKLKVIVSE